MKAVKRKATDRQDRANTPRNPGFPCLGARLGLSDGCAGSGAIALSIEFVAKPEEARNAPALLPAAIDEALKEVTGFAGCLVMVSDQEARLITVVTFWTGSKGRNCCSKNAQWVRALLSKHVDRYLRERTFVAYLPTFPAPSMETDFTAADSLMQESAGIKENGCVA